MFVTSTGVAQREILDLHLWPQAFLSHLNHYLSLFTSFSPAQVDLTCVFPAVCLIFDINLLNTHQSSAECQKHLWPYLPHFPCLFIKCPTVNLKQHLINSVHTQQKHVNYYLWSSVCMCMYEHTHMCTPYSPTFCDPSACHLEPPLPPCHSRTRFTSPAPHFPSPSAVNHTPD